MHILAGKRGGRPQTVEMREVLNAIFYVVKISCRAMLPHDFAPKGMVYHYFNMWRKDGTWEVLNHQLREELRQAMGRDATPSAWIMDNQSKRLKKGHCGFDRHKRVKGRKCHLLVNT